MKGGIKSLMLAILVAVVPVYGGAAKEPDAEYKIKAALIYKLALFVEWPERVFQQPDRPLEICLLGDNPFGSALSVLERRKVRGRPIAVKYYAVSRESVSGGCHLLFVNEARDSSLRELLGSLDGHSILTISDMDGFAETGGMIEMASKDGRVGFRININSLKRGGLKIAAELLNLSTVIQAPDSGAD
jgi:hypothetical protein